jgi:hypothetical protein
MSPQRYFSLRDNVGRDAIYSKKRFQVRERNYEVLFGWLAFSSPPLLRVKVSDDRRGLRREFWGLTPPRVKD